MNTSGFMLDTSIVNRIHERRVNAGRWTLRGPIYVTDIQLQEIAQTPNPEKRHALLRTLLSLGCNIIRPGQSILNGSELGLEYQHGPGCENEFDQPVDELALGRWIPCMVARLPGGPRRLANRFRDAFIAQAAAGNRLTLVTSDRKQSEAAIANGIAVDFIQ